MRLGKGMSGRGGGWEGGGRAKGDEGDLAGGLLSVNACLPEGLFSASPQPPAPSPHEAVLGRGHGGDVGKGCGGRHACLPACLAG